MARPSSVAIASNTCLRVRLMASLSTLRGDLITNGELAPQAGRLPWFHSQACAEPDQHDSTHTIQPTKYDSSQDDASQVVKQNRQGDQLDDALGVMNARKEQEFCRYRVTSNTVLRIAVALSQPSPLCAISDEDHRMCCSPQRWLAVYGSRGQC